MEHAKQMGRLTDITVTCTPGRKGTAWKMYSSFETTLKQMYLEGRDGTAQMICNSCK